MHKRLALIALLAVACLRPAASASQSTQDVVQAPTGLAPILRTDDGAYLWRSASALVDDSGDLVPDPPRLFRRESLAEARGEACIRQILLVDPWDVDTSWPKSLAEFVEHASAVLVGTVVGVEGGFLHGEAAGFMLELAVTDVPKPNPATGRRTRTVFAFYPKGEIAVGGRVVCRLSSQLPGTPRLGDRVLLGLRREPLSLDPVVISLLGTGVEIFIRGDFATYIPKGLDAVPEFADGTDFDELVRRTRNLARNPVRR